MQFAHPSVLWALSLLAIPFAVHLFNLRRYKTIYFSDLRFLKEVQQNTNRQRKLKEWLVLLSRLLMIVALVLAFAMPYLPNNNADVLRGKSIIFLDNSASSQAGTQPYSPFERGKQLALALLEKLPTQNQVALLTASKSSNPVFIPVEDLKEAIKNTQPVDRDAASVLSGNKNSWKGATVYVISDMQQNAFDLAALENDSIQYVLLPTILADEAQLPNVVVDSIWLEAPFLMAGQPVNVQCRIRSYGATTTDAILEISLNDLPEITLSIALKPNSDTIIESNLTHVRSGFNHLKLALGNDAVQFDNIQSRIYFVPLANRVIEVYQNEPSALVAKLFNGNEFEFQAMAANQINNAQLNEADLIILNGLSQISTGLQNQLLARATEANILIIPNSRSHSSINSLASTLGIKTFGAVDTATLASKTVNTSDPFFAEVFSGTLNRVYWPTVKKHFRLLGNSGLPAFMLMQLANGDELFVRYSNGQNNIFQLAVPLDEGFSDLANHPVVVPIFIKSLMKRNNISGFTGTIGADNRFDFSVNQKQEEPALLAKGTLNFIPQQQVFGNRLSMVAGSEIEKAGVYTVLNRSDTLGRLAFCLPRVESDLARYSATDLENWIHKNNASNLRVLQADSSNLGVQFTAWQQGKQLWRWALGLALFLIFVEVILLTYFR